jgi:hypothetical protein
MANWKAVLAVQGLLLLLLMGPSTFAQETQEPTEPEEPEGQVAEQPQQPAEPEEIPAEPADVPEATAEETPERHNGLYVSVGYGMGSFDSFDTSILTDVDQISSGTFEIDEASLGIAAVGWKLREDRGAFRVMFNGYKEESYTYDGIGASSQLVSEQVDLGCTASDLEGLDNVGDSPGFITSPEGGRCLYGWWDVSVRDGRWVAERTPATWAEGADDANGDSAANPEEIVILDPDRRIERSIPDDLQNRLQTVDAVYGREFGGRRYSSQWWAGLRYFVYEGHMLGTAWLDTPADPQGSGFTDGVLLRPLFLAQDASGFGPTVSWEADFNFYNRGLVLYVRGQSAFTFNSISADSGEFFTITRNVGASNPFEISAPARLSEERDKSSWQNTGEVGARVRLRNGLEFELAYRLSGYLDVVLYPSQIRIPASPAQTAAGTTAVYNTQDVRVESWHGAVGFQF